MSLNQAQRAFLSIERSLRILGTRLPAGATAAEITDALVEEIPEIEPDARALLINYQASVYGQTEKLPIKARLAPLRINIAAGRAALRRFFAPVRRFNDRFG